MYEQTYRYIYTVIDIQTYKFSAKSVAAVVAGGDVRPRCVGVNICSFTVVSEVEGMGELQDNPLWLTRMSVSLIMHITGQYLSMTHGLIGAAW